MASSLSAPRCARTRDLPEKSRLAVSKLISSDLSGCSSFRNKNLKTKFYISFSHMLMIGKVLGYIREKVHRLKVRKIQFETNENFPHNVFSLG